jgi:hypothetical protein
MSNNNLSEPELTKNIHIKTTITNIDVLLLFDQTYYIIFVFAFNRTIHKL